ncbi:hypothetical protein [Marinomonas mediterranea]|uniref:MipA/OmpV family protein n=1 Tax=Marinomonas mediterranea (strain ATCC 700492 / JCM 21426 / NBRC 103028 / MMB-1) TaxID=717774 RepID=F2K1L6_MARM1|nr:hypothetical protein [Marinomonas mediterranea]ADZ92246.1 hypothetical protein Marme_3025 [Marinomonas mediterranea MMB-1]WCN10203.1 hypothetical protein GV055_15445 [Marinomonas mediterranea]WCN14247.1 hypothetical protein GV054_15230 [Marinomonas mediterranea]WCN18304.1 hypothetical protein GV053_15320 [Marinomonas mediterranea MMB-1]
MRKLVGLGCFTALFSQFILAEELALPNFEAGVGVGGASNANAYDLDLTINIPLPYYMSGQLLLDSDFISGDGPLGSYSQSEFSGLVYVRNQNGRLGFGLGQKQNKPRDSRRSSESTVIGRATAAFYIGNFTVSTMYINYDSDLDNASSSESGFTYFPTEHRSVSLFREVFDNEEAWRIEMASKYDKEGLSSIRLIARDGSSEDSFYLALQYRYYFDRSYTLKERNRLFY